MTNRISSKQFSVLQFVARCGDDKVCTADVCRYEWSGRGHAATYERVGRLISRGFLRTRPDGSRRWLWLTDKGRAAITK